MTDSLHHRGPDDAGVWVDVPAGIALGHRRLSILDLSPEGHQPMFSPCGRYILVYNGEVYNFGDLRRELESAGHRFRGHSDTEVMLAAFVQWGVKESLARFNGMFAFALWDRQERTLTLARDRMGKKPLFYGWMGGSFLFGSELKALRAHEAFRGEIDRDALTLYLRHNCIPAPYSIYKGIRKLPPGSFMTVRPDRDAPLAPIAYWSMRDVAEQGTKNRFAGTEEEAEDHLDALLRDAVKLRMVADVPLGAFLSGGIDSSTVVALMQAQSARPIQTFTIGFHNEMYNEAEHAKAVARHLGTDHTELYVTPEEAMDVIPLLPTLYDEPFADASQIPTYLVSKLARSNVTVSLSGDGGDELFAGYNRHFQTIWQKVATVSLPAREYGARRIQSLTPAQWNSIYARLSPALPRRLRLASPGEHIHKFAKILPAADPEQMYLELVSHWNAPASMVHGSRELPSLVTQKNAGARLSDFTERIMYLDTITYLPDDILTKVDRASMGVSLEARTPLIDYRVVEYAWSIPLSMKIRDGKGKWLLRQVLYRYVPEELVERPKAGFGIPIHDWLRGSLRDWAESLLDERRLREEGYFDPAPIRARWDDHLAGRKDYQHELWDVLMFQSWLEAQQGSLVS